MSESVCAYIESIYGRLTPFACSRVEFDERALAIERTIDHFDERDNGTKYLRVLSLLQRTSPLKNQTSKIRCTGSLQNKNKKSTSESFSSIDLENCITSDDTDSSNSPRSESNERNYYDNSYGSKRKSQRSKDISPIRKYVRTDSHKQSEQDSKISNIRSKEEQSNEYSLLNELYESSELNEDQRIALIYSKYKKYKKNHKLHPSYYSEWKKFWYKRRSELMQSGINPRTYNFIPEWTTFWPLQMNHFYCDEILKTKIKQRTISIDLTNESLEINKGSSEKTSNELNNSVKLSNDNNMTEPITIDISSDEESPPPISNVKKATPSCTVEQFFSEVAKTGNILGSNNMKNFFEQFSELETEEQKNVIDYCKTLEESE